MQGPSHHSEENPTNPMPFDAEDTFRAVESPDEVNILHRIRCVAG
jgi:hypothetical protein